MPRPAWSVINEGERPRPPSQLHGCEPWQGSGDIIHRDGGETGRQVSLALQKCHCVFVGSCEKRLSLSLSKRNGTFLLSCSLGSSTSEPLALWRLVPPAGANSVKDRRSCTCASPAGLCTQQSRLGNPMTASGGAQVWKAMGLHRMEGRSVACGIFIPGGDLGDGMTPA